MSEVAENFKAAVKSENQTSPTQAVDITKPGYKITRDCPRVTVRFSRDDYKRLQEMADGVALSVYLRAKTLEETLPNGRNLALHLLNVEDNEHAIVHQLNGFMTDDLMGAFGEIEAIAQGTKCRQYLFSLSLSPPKTANVSVAEFEKTIAEIEKRLGLVGQPRAIVFHEKKGRRHAHCVWSRIDVANMKAINLSHYKRKLTNISRELYIEHNWELPAGLKNRKDRSTYEYAHVEAEQAKRVKRNPAELKKLFKDCWESSDSRSAFAAALWENGFCLAQGNRRGFVSVDQQGKTYSLSRWCGVKTKELRSRFGNPEDLPSVDEAFRPLQRQERSAGDTPDLVELEKQHNDNLSEIIERQRNERLEIAERQEQTRLAQIKEVNGQLPKGVKALWAKVTGNWHEQVEHISAQYKTLQQNHDRETQALIQNHLSERQELDRKFEYQRAKLKFEAEVSDQNLGQSVPLLKPDPHQPLILPKEKIPFARDQLKTNPELILGYINEKQAHFNRNDIMRSLAKFIDDPLYLRIAADTVLASDKLVSLNNSTEVDTFTTRDFQKTERELEQHVSEMVGLGEFKVKSAFVEKAIKRENVKLQNRFDASLSDEQIKAIQHATSPDQLSVVVGLAGTGKSTLLSVAKEAWQAQGYNVRGLALAGKAADSLQSASGIKSRTIASLEACWANGNEPLECGDIVVLDEAGMVGTRQLSRVTEKLKQLGCKLVLIGDPNQLQPIEAGTPFKDIAARHKVAKLTEIRRQNSDWQGQASCDLAAGNIEMAFRNYSDHGAIHETQSRDHAISKLVTDYVQDVNEHGEKKSRLALAHRRKDVYAINQGIRTTLQTRNDQSLNVRNGMLATVLKISDFKMIVRIDSEDKKSSRTATFNPSQFSSIDHGYAVTIHRAQGSTVDSSFVLSSQTLDENLTYVAMTRHKQDASFYTAPEIETKRIRITENRTRAKTDLQNWVPDRSR